MDYKTRLRLRQQEVTGGKVESGHNRTERNEGARVRARA